MKPNDQKETKAGHASAFRRGLRYLAALALVGLTLAWQADVFTVKIRSGESEDSRPSYENSDLAVVREVESSSRRQLVGAVVPRTRIELSARISGQIESVEVDSGDFVSAGDTVVVLDREIPRARRDEASAALEVARAELVGAERLLERVREAAEARAIPETERIDAERVRNAAAQAVKQAEAALSGAENQLGFTRIQSPVTGVVARRLKDPGDQVLPGSPVLILYQPDRLEVAVNVPASLSTVFKPGAEISCRIPALGKEFQAMVRTRVPSADTATRSVIAKLEGTLPDDAIPGLYVEADIAVTGRMEKVLVIPASSVEMVRQIPFVHVIGEDGKSFRRVIRRGEQRGKDVVVLAGLEAGDRVLRQPPPESGGGHDPSGQP